MPDPLKGTDAVHLMDYADFDEGNYVIHKRTITTGYSLVHHDV